MMYCGSLFALASKPHFGFISAITSYRIRLIACTLLLRRAIIIFIIVFASRTTFIYEQ